MQELFFTILAVWVIWKLFNAFSSRESNTQSYHQTNTHHHHYHSSQKNGGENVRVETKQNPKSRFPSDEGEYVDYEDVK